MAEQFTRSVSQLVCAQICESFGFQSIQRSALETLSDILTRFITSVGDAAHADAELAGRTDVNAFDITLALSDVGTSLSDLARFVEFADDASAPSLAQSVPPFPVPRQPRFVSASFLQAGEQPPPRGDIPEWLPALPDPHTYIATPVWEARGQDKRQDRVEEGRERRRAEQSLVSLHQRMGMVTAGGTQSRAAAGAGRPLWGGWSDPGRPALPPIPHPAIAPRISPGAAPAVLNAGGAEQGERRKKRRRESASGGGALPGQVPSALDAFAGLMQAVGKDPRGGGAGDALEESEEEDELGEGMEGRNADAMAVDGGLELVEGGEGGRTGNSGAMGGENRTGGNKGDGVKGVGWSGWSAVEGISGAGVGGVSFHLGSKIRAKLGAARMQLPVVLKQPRAKGGPGGLDGSAKGDEDKERKGKERKEKGKDDERDEKRKRAEQILEQAEREAGEAAS